MDVSELFIELLEHLQQGINFHEQATNYFSFLTLRGYEKCQEYHYYEEIRNYRKLYNYYINNYCKLLKLSYPRYSDLIDSNLYKYTREQLDTNTIRVGARTIMRAWVKWEDDTKIFLETKYKQLVDLNEIAAALEVSKLIKDVSKELQHAKDKKIQLELTDYDIVMIQEEQVELYKEYKDKIACMK